MRQVEDRKLAALTKAIEAEEACLTFVCYLWQVEDRKLGALTKAMEAVEDCVHQTVVLFSPLCEC